MTNRPIDGSDTPSDGDRWAYGEAVRRNIERLLSGDTRERDLHVRDRDAGGSPDTVVAGHPGERHPDRRRPHVDDHQVVVDGDARLLLCEAGQPARTGAGRWLSAARWCDLEVMR